MQKPVFSDAERVGGTSLRQAASKDAAETATRRQSPNRSASAALLNDEQAAREVFNVSPRTFAELMKEPWMPKPLVLGPRLRRWVRTELEAAIVNAPRQRLTGGEPAQLARARIDAMKRTAAVA